MPDDLSVAPARPSYRELWLIPGMPPLAASVALSRWVLDGMLPVTWVLTCLRLFDSPAIAGLVVFLGTAPGLLLTPVAGALLDRRGRIAFIRIDVYVAMAAMTVLAVLIWTDRLTVPVIVVIAVLVSCTRPLAQAGARAQVPTMTPRRLWDRVNAVDNAVFTAVSLTGPAVAAALFGLLGAALVYVAEAALLLVAALVLTRVAEVIVAVDPASVWRETRAGLAYFLRNRTLVALAVSSSLLNFAPGTIIVVLPVIIVRHLHDSTALVGVLLATEQVGAAVGVVAAGRFGTQGREVRLMVTGAVICAAGVGVMLATGSVPVIAAGIFVVGLGGGPYWVALYGLRQRRTVPHMFARAFALSYAGNVAGQPLASGIAGWLAAAGGVSWALGLAVAGPLLAVLALAQVPRAAPGVEPGVTAR